MANRTIARRTSNSSRPDAYTRAAAESRGATNQATRAIGHSEPAPAPIIDTEINAEMIGLSTANHDLSSLITALTERLEPILTPPHPHDESSAQEAPVSPLGHRIREEATAVHISAYRIQQLLNRLAI